MQAKNENTCANLTNLFKNRDLATQDNLIEEIMVSYNILNEINSDKKINSLLKDSDV